MERCKLVLLSRRSLQHNLPACVDQLRGWPTYRDQPLSRKLLQYRMPLSQGGDREHGKKLIIL